MLSLDLSRLGGVVGEAADNDPALVLFDFVNCALHGLVDDFIVEEEQIFIGHCLQLLREEVVDLYLFEIEIVGHCLGHFAAQSDVAADDEDYAQRALVVQVLDQVAYWVGRLRQEQVLHEVVEEVAQLVVVDLLFYLLLVVDLLGFVHCCCNFRI